MSRRLPTGGLIDRDRPVRVRVDGREYTGFAGDTIASTLLAAGVWRVGDSLLHGRPRGIWAAGGEEPNAFVQILSPFPEPMVAATRVEIVEGLEVVTLSGKGRLMLPADESRYDAIHAHADVAVVGAGPAGLAAAVEAAGGGRRVLLLDDRPVAGGALPDRDHRDQVATLAQLEGVTVLHRTTAVGLYDDGYLVAVERRTDHLPQAPEHVARRRLWRIRAGRVVVATGATERPIAFAGNDLPGVMLAGAAAEYLHRYAVLVAERPVVFTTHDLAYRAVAALAEAGGEVAAVVDARSRVPESAAAVCQRYGIALHQGSVVTAAHGDDAVGSVELGTGHRVDCDALLVSGGWAPATALLTHTGVPVRYDQARAAFLPDSTSPAGSEQVTVTGAAAGHGLPEMSELWLVPGADTESAYVDLARDATAADLDRALNAGLRSIEHLKRYTTIATGPDQGRTSALLTAGIVAQRLGVTVAEVGTPRQRPPVVPVGFAEIAGRRRGDLADPVRRSPLHRRHLQLGAVFENVGQWKRARYYPQQGRDGTEDMAAAVRRECLAARTGVAIMDASTLGIIEVTGPDAGVFLDQLYTNRLSSLRTGRLRYTMMCGLDGMVVDDGTVARIDEEHFRVSTTTGGAAAVLDSMEQWRQTEWPYLRVHLTSTTDHWATIAVVGPRSRQVLAAVTDGIDVSAEAFGFMTWQVGQVAGAEATVCRVSFSGELAFEVYVPWWRAERVWDALVDHGADAGITPYGTETMHVLRAEKGFVIVGQDTDGTVTPHDLGYGWIVADSKDDFLGKRSLTRPDTQRADRKQLVGLLTVDDDLAPALLPEGAPVVAMAELPKPPVPILGHVTSSYDSAAIGRPIALALVGAGRQRMGTTVYAVLDGRTVPCRVVDPVFYDPEGRRRDGDEG